MKRPPLTGEDFYRVRTAARRVFPRVLPGAWREGRVSHGDPEFQKLWDSDGGMRVIAEIEIVDAQLWVHVSVSQRGRLPTWEELRDAAYVILGRKTRAIQVLPPEDEYVNLHPYVLHVYAPIDHEPIPDFRGEYAPGKLGL